MRRARWYGLLPLMALMLPGPAVAASPAGVGRPDRGAIEQVFKSIETAVGARDAEAALAAYDGTDAALVDRTRSLLRGSLALDGFGVTYRLGALLGGAPAEAVVLRSATYTEHGRRQRDERWETVRLRSAASGWKITSEEERPFARCAETDLQVEIDPDKGILRGTSTLRVEVTAPGEDSLLLRLNRGLEVTALTDARRRPVRFERTADAIAIPQPRPLRTGDRRTLTFRFEGALFNESQEQGFSQVSIAPEGSFASWVTGWYPRLSGTGSKSTGRIAFDVPAGLTVASSGRLSESTVENGRARSRFAVDRPLDFSFAAASYFHREASVDGTRLGVYLLRGGDAKADLYIKESTRVLRYQRVLYGAYPFDGYAIVEIPSEKTGALGGSSEQGMNLFPAGVLPDDTFPLLLLAHEMGHSWWGNLIASGDGPLLDEGLAQATAVLCLREFQGDAAMRNFLKRGVPGYRQSASQYFLRFAGPGEKDYPIGSAATGSDAGSALHDLADTKGMFVFAMLRDAIGHEAFVRGLRAIVDGFAGKTAALADLRAAWEKASGADLGPFFRQWMFRTGAPDLSITSAIAPADQGFVVSGSVTQSGDLYDLTVPIALAAPGRREIRTLALSGATTPFSFRADARPEWVVLDPDYTILRWTPAFRNYALLSDGLGLWSAGKKEETLAKLQEYVAKAPESLEGRYRLGLVHEESGAPDLAEPLFREVLDRYSGLGIYEPAVALSQLHLGHVLDLRDRRDGARESYERTLAFPDESGSHADARAGLDAPFRLRARAEAPGPDVLARFVGTYDNGNGIALQVGLKDRAILTVAQPGKPEGSLEWIEGARFHVAAASDIVIEFVGAPQITGLDLTLAGNLIHLQRGR